MSFCDIKSSIKHFHSLYVLIFKINSEKIHFWTRMQFFPYITLDCFYTSCELEYFLLKTRDSSPNSEATCDDEC